MQKDIPARVQLGGFELDLKAGELRKGTRKIRLQEQPFRILEMLVNSAGELVTREEIRKRLWPNDTVVEFDHSIHTAINKLRQALNDSAEAPKFIETVARRGYRLLVPVNFLSVTLPVPPAADEASKSRLEAANQLEAERAGLIGRRVSHYRVLDIIGGGGMGVVYRAEDLKLGRRVALKFLPEELASEPIALQRFEREARTASSLNHPNICTIYEIDEHEGQSFIVMELLDGETLRDRLARCAENERATSLRELLDIAIPVTDGLDAAHQKGIIHRDIKPANIFLTAQGQVKILDFGLAKLATVATESDTEDQRLPIAQFGGLSKGVDTTLTRTGSAMGTAGYMSPEQVRGEKLDVRTDLFSLGLVLYEMASGQRAFAGESAAVVHEAILNRTAVPLHHLNPAMLPRLERVINKALEKNRGLRYQSAADMSADLNSIKSELSARTNTRSGGTKIFKWSLIAGAALAIAILGTITFGTLSRQVLPPREMRQTQITANSHDNPVRDGSISPDGRYLGYTDATGMHIKLLETGDLQDIPKPEIFKGQEIDSGLFPMSASKFIVNLYVFGKGDSLWTVPITGGKLQELRADAAVPSVSPDGSTIAFMKDQGEAGYREIWLMDANGGHERKLSEAGENSTFQYPKWSADGRKLIYREEVHGAGPIQTVIESRDLHGGAPTVLVADPRLWTFVPLPGRLVYSLFEQSVNGLSCDLREVPVDSSTGLPKGKPRQLTNWGGVCTGNPTASADGKRLVLSKFWTPRSVYVSRLDHRASIDPRRLTLNDGLESPIGWTADSKQVVFLSNRNGTWGIFKQSPDEQSAQPIAANVDYGATVGGPDAAAAVSPDGASVFYQAFSTWTAGRLMRVPINGGTSESVLTITSAPEPLSFMGIDGHLPPRCAKSPASLCAIAERTPDERHLVFTSFDGVRGRGRELIRFNIDPSGIYRWDLSPDGACIAILKLSQNHIHILGLNGQPEQDIEVYGWNNLENVNWASDGKGLFISSPKKGNSILLYVDLNGKATALWEQPGELEGNLDTYAIPSPDGQHLALFGWTSNSNMWMLENF